jgi:hypothetical protein
MLAAMRDYFFLWQLPAFGAFAAAWLIGGPYLTRRALERYTGFFVVRAKKSNIWWLTGAVLGLPVMLVMSWAVVSVVLNLPAKTLLRVALSTTGPLTLLLLLVAVAAFAPARFVRQAQLARQRCRINLQFIDGALGKASSIGQLPESLRALTESGLIKTERLACPAKPEVEVGYLYVPSLAAARTDSGDEQREVSQKIWVCDRRGNHRGRRLVLHTDGRILELEESDFRKLLERPENEELKKLVAAEQ